MRTKDFIQLLELTPKMPVKVEYLPGLFVQEGFVVTKIDKVKDDASDLVFYQVHLSDQRTKDQQLQTTELFKAFQKYIDPEKISEEEIRIVYGNKDFQRSALDITEIEVHHRNFTLKLFLSNNLKMAKEKDALDKKENPIRKRKKRFSSMLKKLLIPLPLRVSWNIPWVQCYKIN